MSTSGGESTGGGKCVRGKSGEATNNKQETSEDVWKGAGPEVALKALRLKIEFPRLVDNTKQVIGPRLADRKYRKKKRGEKHGMGRRKRGRLACTSRGSGHQNQVGTDLKAGEK